MEKDASEWVCFFREKTLTLYGWSKEEYTLKTSYRPVFRANGGTFDTRIGAESSVDHHIVVWVTGTLTTVGLG
jgi:hypothetical protein